MNESITISCDISPTDSADPVGLEIHINDQQIFNQDQVTEPVKLNHTVQLPENQEHVVKFTLKNKQSHHTTINDSGEIVKDSSIMIEHLAFDELELGQIVVEHAVYEHNFNGTGQTIQDKFYNYMGCNGTVSLKFDTPVYLWLLENI